MAEDPERLYPNYAGGTDMMDSIYDLLDIAAKKKGMKEVAHQLMPYKREDKATSTLYGELNRQPNHKLGLITAILIMQITGDLSALDRIEAMFNRVAFVLPKPDFKNVGNIISMTADLTKEFGEHMIAVAKAMEDGEITKQEAKQCLKELRDLVEVCMKLQAYFERI